MIRGWSFLALLASGCGLFGYSVTDGDSQTAANDAGTSDYGWSAQAAASPWGYVEANCTGAEVAKAGIFVSVASGKDDAAGTASAPVKTLAHAIDLAAVQANQNIYVEEGVYPESLTIERPLVVTIEGGWQHTNDGWKKDCSAGVIGKTTISGPSAVGLRIAAAHIAIRRVTLRSKAAGDSPGAASGETCFASALVHDKGGTGTTAGAADDVLVAP